MNPEENLGCEVLKKCLRWIIWKFIEKHEKSVNNIVKQEEEHESSASESIHEAGGTKSQTAATHEKKEIETGQYSREDSLANVENAVESHKKSSDSDLNTDEFYDSTNDSEYFSVVVSLMLRKLCGS